MTCKHLLSLICSRSFNFGGGYVVVSGGLGWGFVGGVINYASHCHAF